MGRTAFSSARMLPVLLIFILVLQTGAWASPEEDSRSTDPKSAETSPASSPGENSGSRNNVAVPATSAPLPDSPGALRAKQEAPQDAPNQPESSSQEKIETQPVGTAAAESLVTTGVAAAQPAGAAVAPAKQRRLRSILLKTGAIVGVGAAVGTVVALSAGSPNKPPGSR